MSGRQTKNRAKTLPRLVPTGSLNKVLLVGGKNLTLLQSVGLLVFGVLALGTGAVLLRIGELWFVLWGFAISLWGLVMLFNGSRGAIRAIRKRYAQSGKAASYR
jgi:hypothetical protein